MSRAPARRPACCSHRVKASVLQAASSAAGAEAPQSVCEARATSSGGPLPSHWSPARPIARPASFWHIIMVAALIALAAVLTHRAAAVTARAEQSPAAASVAAQTLQRHLRHRRRWRASRLASRHSPFTTHTSLPDARNCSWKTLTQQLDHFGSLSTTFDQRLCLYDGFATNNVTRVLLYVGNESPVDEYVNNTGLMWGIRFDATGHAAGLGRAPLRGAIHARHQGSPSLFKLLHRRTGLGRLCGGNTEAPLDLWKRAGRRRRRLLRRHAGGLVPAEISRVRKWCYSSFSADLGSASDETAVERRRHRHS